MKTILVIFTISFCSCTSFLDEPVYEIDDELRPYYDLFLYEGIKRGQDYSGKYIRLYFDDHPEYYGYSHGGKVVDKVSIDRGSWSKLHGEKTPKERQFREWLIMHELGHAFLGRTHANDCSSIMIINKGCVYSEYEINREEMLNELFGT